MKIAPCSIADSEWVYILTYGGREGALSRAPATDPGAMQQVDFLRLPEREQAYLRVVAGMLIMLEWMQKER